MKLILTLQTCITLILTGTIWFVQVIHYPLFTSVDPKSFPQFHREHVRRTSCLIAPLMGTEALTLSALILFWRDQFPSLWLWTMTVLLLIVWLSTVFIQIPRHQILSQGFQKEIHRQLLTSNWIRTTAWTIKSLVCLQLLKTT